MSPQKIASALAAMLVMAGPVVADEPSRAPETPVGHWLAEDIRGGGVVDRVQTTLVLGEDGSVGGRGGCNAYTGSRELDGDRIKFGPLASTMMACPPAVMDQERKFFDALEAVTAWRALTDVGKLELLGSEGEVLVIFSAMDSAE